MRRMTLAAVLVLITAGPLSAAQVDKEKLTTKEGVEWLNGELRRAAAKQCTGKYCCCDLARRGIICAPRSKCKGGGARCTDRQSCPR